MITQIELNDSQIESFRWGVDALMKATHRHPEEFGPVKEFGWHLVFLTQAVEVINAELESGKHGVYLAHT